jgi:hypothetical protein
VTCSQILEESIIQTPNLIVFRPSGNSQVCS